MKLNILKLILDAGITVKFVLLLLAGFSVVSWGIIFLKVRTLKRARENTDRFLEFFWSQRNMEHAYKKA
jgi:biopolymer transport protein TolQ